MNELLTEYATKALTWLESGAMWIQGEIPVYINELIKWTVASHIFGICVGILLFLLIPLGINLFKRARNARSSDAEFGYEFSGVMSIVGGAIAGVSTVLPNIYRLVKVLVAPRVWMIEYLSNIISSN